MTGAQRLWPVFTQCWTTHLSFAAFITTADYERKAYDVATELGFPRIGLINGRQLVDLLVEHWRDIPEEFQSKLGLKIGLVLSG